MREGLLLFIPSSVSDDFLALEMANRKIRFLWNVGGGTGVVTHPQIIEGGNFDEDDKWYRIEAQRIRHLGRLSVRKQSSSSGK